MVARKAIQFLLSAFILLGVDSYAKGGVESGNPIDTPEEINAYIRHHLQDSHDFIFYTDGETGHHVGFSLPVILWDEGIHVFSSGGFHHGESVVESKGNFYKLYHGKVYKSDAFGKLTFEIMRGDSIVSEVEAENDQLALEDYISNNQLDSAALSLTVAGSHPKDPMPLDLAT